MSLMKRIDSSMSVGSGKGFNHTEQFNPLIQIESKSAPKDMPSLWTIKFIVAGGKFKAQRLRFLVYTDRIGQPALRKQVVEPSPAGVEHIARKLSV